MAKMAMRDAAIKSHIRNSMAEVGVISSYELTELAPSDYSSREGKLSQDHQGCPSAFVCSSPAEWTRGKRRSPSLFFSAICLSPSKRANRRSPPQGNFSGSRTRDLRSFRACDVCSCFPHVIRIVAISSESNRRFIPGECLLDVDRKARTIFDVARDPRSASMRTHLVHC